MAPPETGEWCFPGLNHPPSREKSSCKVFLHRVARETATTGQRESSAAAGQRRTSGCSQRSMSTSWSPLWPRAGEPVGEPLGEPLGDALGDALRLPLGDALGDALRLPLGEPLPRRAEDAGPPPPIAKDALVLLALARGKGEPPGRGAPLARCGELPLGLPLGDPRARPPAPACRYGRQQNQIKGKNFVLLGRGEVSQRGDQSKGGSVKKQGKKRNRGTFFEERECYVVSISPPAEAPQKNCLMGLASAAPPTGSCTNRAVATATPATAAAAAA